MTPLALLQLHHLQALMDLLSVLVADTPTALVGRHGRRTEVFGQMCLTPGLARHRLGNGRGSPNLRGHRHRRLPERPPPPLGSRPSLARFTSGASPTANLTESRSGPVDAVA